MAIRRIKSSDFVGVKFGRLTITSIEMVKRGLSIRAMANAICECGDSRQYFFGNIKRGVTTSCGCYNSEIAQKKHTQPNPCNGLSRHPLYRTWRAMRSRCYNPTDVSYYNYGAKGVTVCEEWRNDFMVFYNWAMANGWEIGLQIDKDIKGDGKLYSPATCCFVTPKVNVRARTCNYFVTYNNVTRPLSEWCELLNMKYTTIRRRLKSGMNAAEAFLKIKYA